MNLKLQNKLSNLENKFLKIAPTVQLIDHGYRLICEICEYHGINLNTLSPSQIEAFVKHLKRLYALEKPTLNAVYKEAAAFEKIVENERWREND
jgi:hypothetical protein